MQVLPNLFGRPSSAVSATGHWFFLAALPLLHGGRAGVQVRREHRLAHRFNACSSLSLLLARWFLAKPYMKQAFSSTLQASSVRTLPRPYKHPSQKTHLLTSGSFVCYKAFGTAPAPCAQRLLPGTRHAGRGRRLIERRRGAQRAFEISLRSDRFFIHLAMSDINDKGEGPQWFEKVSDEDYAKTPAPVA